MSGKIVLKPKSASLLNDVKLLGAMSPYIIAQSGDHKFTSAVSHKGGKTPNWVDNWSFQRGLQTQLDIELWNKRKLGSDDMIGYGKLDITKFFNGGIWNETIYLTYNQAPAGHLMMEVQFIPIFGGPREVLLKLKSANFENTKKNKNKSPYVKISGSNKNFVSAVNKDGNYLPIWVDEFKFIRKLEDNLTFEVCNGNKSMGTGLLQSDFLNLFPGGPTSIPLVKKGKLVGNLNIELYFKVSESNTNFVPFQPAPYQPAPYNPYAPPTNNTNIYVPPAPAPYFPPGAPITTTVTKEIIVSPTHHNEHHRHGRHGHRHVDSKEVIITQTTTQNVPPPSYNPNGNIIYNPSTPSYTPPPAFGNPVPTSNPYLPPNFTAPAPTNNYTPPPTNNYAPPPTNNYAPPPTNNYAPPPTNNYAPPPTNNYAPPPTNNYAPPPTNNYAPPPNNNYTPPPTNSYGAPPTNNYAPPPTNIYGAPPNNNYGAPPPGNYAPPPSSSNNTFGAPPSYNYPTN